MVEDEDSNCAYLASLDGAIQQVIIMGLSDDDVVVEQACKIIGNRLHFRLVKSGARPGPAWWGVCLCVLGAGGRTRMAERGIVPAAPCSYVASGIISSNASR